jgi:hypothetical protein
MVERLWNSLRMTLIRPRLHTFRRLHPFNEIVTDKTPRLPH